ncbi:MAG: class I SAM-dependent methyltransferase [Thermoprotei archaeon]
MSGGLKEDWNEVVQNALDRLIPVYDKMNSVMSFGQDIEWRKWGLSLVLKPNSRILDAGCGPGVMSQTLLELDSEARPVLYDALASMLSEARNRLGKMQRGLVRGIFEKMPFSDNSFDVVTMGFSFRDSQDMSQALSELSRVIAPNGSLLIVDISKPDSALPRLAIGFYWRILVPFIAMLAVRSYWRYYSVLHTTYRRLPRNSQLQALVSKYFEEVHAQTKMSGGMMILTAFRPRKSRPPLQETAEVHPR